MTRLRIFMAGTAGLCALLAVSGSGGAAPVLPRNLDPAPTPVIRVAGLFGESDEEKAARLQHEANQDAQIRALNDKVNDLQQTVQMLTGQNEELSHRVSELSDRIARQQKDFEARLCALAAQQLGAEAGQGDPNAVPCPGAPAATTLNVPPPPAEQPQAGQPTQRLAPGPGVLGTLPAGTDTTGGAPPQAAADPHAQYTAAMNLLAKARYDEASAAFRTFADTYPKDDLAPQAIYWIADIAYVQKDYGNAARLFAEVIKKYPTSPRAADSMLKLGQAMMAAGQKKEGCTLLAALPEKYPKAPKALLAQGADARKACRGLV